MCRFLCFDATFIVGCCLPLLGRLSVEEMAKKRALRYFHKSMCKAETNLVKITLNLQKQMADNGRNCWGLEIKKLLVKLGLEYIWHNPFAVSHKKFKKISNKKFAIFSLDRRRESLLEFKSAKYINQLNLKMRILPHNIKIVS